MSNENAIEFIKVSFFRILFVYDIFLVLFASLVSQFMEKLDQFLFFPINILIMGIYGITILFPLIMAPMAMNTWGHKLKKTRLVASTLIIAGLFLLGLIFSFSREQWLLLDVFLCGQLIALTYVTEDSYYWNVGVFVLMLLVGFFAASLWRLFDLGVIVYFLVLCVLVLTGKWKLAKNVKIG